MLADRPCLGVNTTRASACSIRVSGCSDRKFVDAEERVVGGGADGLDAVVGVDPDDQDVDDFESVIAATRPRMPRSASHSTALSCAQ
jgi:hypothetical protein